MRATAAEGRPQFPSSPAMNSTRYAALALATACLCACATAGAKDTWVEFKGKRFSVEIADDEALDPLQVANRQRLVEAELDGERADRIR